MEKVISKILKYGTLISAYLLIGSVLLQIFSRFLLENTPAWTEEASRLFFIYAISFAAGLAMKNKYYVHLDFFYEMLSLRTKSILMVLISGSSFLLFGIFTYYSFHFMILGHNEFSPSMTLRMSVVFFSMVILGSSICYYTLKDTFRLIQKFKS